MKSILGSFIAVSTALAISLSSPAFGQDEDAAAAQAEKKWDALGAQTEKIVQQELMKKYEGTEALRVKPRDIDFKQNPKLKALNEKFPSLWKQINPQIADAYTATVKPVNEKNNANASKTRPSLTDAFGKAIELRGGGSASSMLAAYSSAQVEWMIGNVARKHYEPMLDDAFVSKLAKALNLPDEENLEHETEIRNALPAVLAAIKKAEAFLPPDQSGFIRAEFLAYFQEESKEAAPSDQSGAEHTKQPISAEILVKTAGKADANPNPIGNVQVTYADGTKDLWTTKGNCSLAGVRADGTVGWTVHGPEEKVNSADTMRPNGILTLCRRGKVIAKIKSRKNYIEEWSFTADGSQLVLLTRESHGPAMIELHDTTTGKLVESFKAGDKNPPAWAEPYKDK